MEVINKETVRAWQELFRKYQNGKRHLDRRIIEAEQAWKLRHWEQLREHVPGDPEPASAWLVNVILSKHSDACEAYPTVTCLAREPDDEPEAAALTAILPVILSQNDFEKVWSDVWWYKLKGGTGVYGVFWDASLNNGLGDIAVKKVEILNLFWEPGIADIQSSPCVFYTERVKNDALRARYGDLPLTSGSAGQTADYRYEENIDKTDTSIVYDVYYKKSAGGRTVLHYAKFVGDTVLFATENEPRFSAGGLYAHGKYPFVFDALFPEEGYPNCGFGYVDLCRDAQKYIDLMDNAFLKNVLAGAAPRWFIRSDGGVNEEEYGDFTRPFVHVNGRLGDDSIKPITHTGLDSSYVALKQYKIEELKQVSGNRDVNNGGTASSVTAASAIAALQEAGSGISRDMIAASYRAYRQVITLCIELMREFYDAPRRFRILGAHGTYRYLTYNNSGLLRRLIAPAEGLYRLPVFDVSVEVEKETAYRTDSYNTLALDLYKLGFFAPENAPQALAALSLMDFKGKDALEEKIRQGVMIM